MLESKGFNKCEVLKSYNPKKKPSKPKTSTKGLGKDILETIATAVNPRRRRPTRRKKSL